MLGGFDLDLDTEGNLDTDADAASDLGVVGGCATLEVWEAFFIYQECQEF